MWEAHAGWLEGRDRSKQSDIAPRPWRRKALCKEPPGLVANNPEEAVPTSITSGMTILPFCAIATIHCRLSIAGIDYYGCGESGGIQLTIKKV